MPDLKDIKTRQDEIVQNNLIEIKIEQEETVKKDDKKNFFKGVIDQIKNITIQAPEVPKAPDVIVPEIKVPDIKVNVPKPEVTVNVKAPPMPKIPKPEITVNVKAPPAPKIPPIKVPKPEVTVNIPPIEFPEMPDEMFVFSNRSKPLHVILTDSEGRTYKVASGGGSGGGPRIVKTIKEKSDSAIHTALSIKTTATDVIVGNTERKQLILINDSDETMYLSLGGDALLNEGIRLNASGGTYSDDVYIGPVSAIVAVNDKNLLITEL